MIPMEMRKQPGFPRMVPARRTKLLASGQILPKTVARFAEGRTQSNLLKQVRGSIPGIASSFRRYRPFCEMTKTTTLPPTEEAVLRRSGVFNDTAVCGNYISRVRKARFFLRRPYEWINPAARHVANGLEKSQNKSCRFACFIRNPMLVMIVDHDAPISEFGQSAFLRFSPPFRATSETLQMLRSYLADDLSFPPPHQEGRLSSRGL